MVAPNRQPQLLALVEELLSEQRRLQTPVVRASAAHDQYSTAAPGSPLNRQLIPLSAPGPDEQYAFEVNLDACSGCKSCVVACHAMNGLDPAESWRDVGSLTGGCASAPYLQTITTACHHCADPGCLNGCPVLAYEKDPRTGIVRHLDDQCIGCQYCVLKCPYDVPKYNARLGIVRKCDMCHQRLATGEAPACAQSCPTHAIRIVKVPVHTATGWADTSQFLSAAPDPAFTQPTTRYISKRPIPTDARATDAGVLRPQPPHWPLIVMLTLISWAVSTQALALTPFAAQGSAWPSWLPLALGVAGLGAATFHLGRPLRAWRVFLGLGRSWFSREAVLFGVWFGVTAAALRLPALTAAAAVIGLLGLFCSVMIYADTHRRFWRLAQTAPRFFGTGTILALAPLAPRAAALCLVAKMLWEIAALRDGGISARLQLGPLRGALTLRIVLGALGAGVLMLSPLIPSTAGALALPVLLAGELAERYLFFRAVDAPRMPGLPDPAAGVPA